MIFIFRTTSAEGLKTMIDLIRSLRNEEGLVVPPIPRKRERDKELAQATLPEDPKE